MKKNIFTLLVCLMACCFGFAQNNVIDNELQKILNQKGNDYIDVNIMLKAQMTSDDFAVLNCESDSKEVRRELVTNELKKFAENSQKDIMSVLQAEERSNKVTDIKNFWIANFINCKAKADVIYQLASHPDVATISYNSVMEVVDDTEETNSSDTRAITATIGDHLKQIKADEAWKLGYTGKNVVVAVLDSGVNTDHTDLKDHLWNGNAQHGYNVVNPGSAPVDDRSHGTHCAGIICGDGTSGSLTGVAPDATLMSIKLYDSNAGLTVDRLLAGVQFAADKEADILSISQGWLGASDANRNTLRTTFENLLQQGIIAVVAAGNDRIDIATYPVPGNIRTPGDCPPPWIHPDQKSNEGGKSSVVSVGAVDDKNEIVGISSQGPVTWEGTSYNDYPYNEGASMGLIRPDIVAPATILSLSNASNTQYVIKGGTSQAAPCVAGVMALMLEKNRDLTPEDLCRIVETTATQKTAKKDNLYGSGVVDALKAVRYVDFHVDTSVIRPYAFTSILNAYENVDFELTLINNGEAATNGTTTVTISESDDYTTIVEDTKTYAQMAVDATASATFIVSFDHLIPDNHEVTFTINAGGHIFDLVVTVSNELVPPTLTATANGTDINLSWNETNNATSYNIYRDGVLLTNTTSTSYTDTGLEYGTIYAYNITTKRNDLESEHSLTVRVQTKDNPNRPSPTNVVATDNGTYVNVTWTNGKESNASNIYRKDINTGTETNIATNVNGASYNDNNWDSVEDGIYQYGVANTYAANESIYTEGFENTTVTADADEYTSSNAIWYKYNEGSDNRYWWNINTSITHSTGRTDEAFSGNAFFIYSPFTSPSFLSYLVSPKFNYTQHNGSDVKLSFRYITPAWDKDINTLKVMVSTTSYNSGWTELWSSNKTDVQGWPEQVVDLSAYVGQEFYIAFVNVAGYGYYTGVDNVNISIEGSSESRIEWSDNVYKNVNIFVQDGLWSNTDNWSAKRLPNETEKVIIDANATIKSGDIIVNSLVINEGKSLTLDNGVALTVKGDFANTDADAFIINDGAQVFQSNDDVAATFLMNIVSPRDTEGYSSEEEFNPTGWQFIASPMKDAKINDFVPTFNYDLFKYDGTQELEWLNHKYEPIELTAPQNLMAEATGTTTIRLSWAPVEGATSYNVYDGNDVPFATTADNIFEITELTPGTQYCYTVTSATADNESEKPSAVCTKTITLAPQLVANMASHSSIVLSWNAVAGAELYHVYKGNEKIASVTSMSYTVNGLNPATEYCFTVTSVGSEFLGIESAKSNEECATTDITAPTAPQNVVATATNPYSITLTWDAVAGADTYNIYLGNTSVVEYITSTEYTINGLNPGGQYCYTVTAVNRLDESPKSEMDCATTPLPTPEAPQLTATPVGSAVELTWNAPAYAATYKVYDEEGLVAEGLSSTTYTVYDLEAGEHCFTVIAVNAEGSESGASNTDCAITTAQDPDTPIAEHVIIGEGNSTSIALPIYSNCAYSISQQIYTRAEIGQTGSIKAVSFKYKSGLSEPCTRTVKVYLQQTTKAFFTSGTDWVSMTDADLVYDGNITINGIADEWVRIKLNTPFEYTRNNLVVCVYDYTGEADSEITFAADQINELKGMSYYNTMSPSPLNPSNVDKTGFYNPIKRNQIRFSFVTGNEPAIPAAPSNLIATCSQESTFIGTGDGGNPVYEYANAITLTWDADATAETYYIYDETDNIIGQTSGTTFTIDGLETATRYCYYVSAENETGEGAKAEVCTTTITARPQNLIVEAIDYTTINLSWTPVEGATSYNIYEGNNYTPDADATFIGNTDVCSYDVENLTKGIEYCYFVKAVNEGGESFRSPAECAEAGDVVWTCTVKFELIDSYGDGWGGNNLYVSYGDVKNKQMTLSTGSTTEYTLDIPTGSTCYIVYKPEGGYQYENTFVISYYGGDVIYTSPEMKKQIHEDSFVVNCEPSEAAVPTITAAPISDKQIVLTMESAGATRFNIYKGGELLVKGVKEDTYTVDNLDPSTNYCFTATAFNVLGETEQSEPACATTYEAGTTIVQVGGNGTSTSPYTPIYDYFNPRAVTQTIYTQEEIANSAGFIKSISYKNAQGANNVRNIAVYLKNTDSEYFSTGTSAWESLEDAVCVYQGNFTFSTTDWVEIETQEDFLYEGGNLLVCVIDNTGTNPGTAAAADYFHVYTVGTNDTDRRSIYGSSSTTTAGINIIATSTPVKNGTEYVSPIAKFRMTEVPPFVKVTPETIALGKVQLGEYWSEKEDVTASVTVKPIMTTITNITCDNPFFSVSGIDYTAKSMNLTVSYDKNASAGEKTGNLTITYGDGATKVVPMTATAYTPVTPDVYELAQEITFTENAYTDTPVFANLNDDYNLPKEVNAGSTPDAVYTFELTEETPLTVNITGTNAVATIYSEDFGGEGGPMANNNNKGIVAGPTGPTTFFYDFNDESLADFDIRDIDDDGYNWEISGTVIQGFEKTKGIESKSYNGSKALYPDNYIITKEAYAITSNSQLSYYVESHPSWPQEHYSILLIENIEDLSSATVVYEETLSAETIKKTKTHSLAEYNGKVAHIAIRHHNCSDKYSMVIDNLQLTDGSTRSVKSRAAEPQINTVSYPAGRYYLVAAAEDAFTVDVTIPVTPEIPEGTPTTFFYDFNDGNLDDFNLIDSDGDGNNWGTKDYYNIDTEYITSYSWKSSAALYPNNYIVTKQAYSITESSKLLWKSRTGEKDHYAIYVSNDENIANFELVYEETPPSWNAWYDREIELSNFTGVKYIAIRHFNSGGNYNICIDDFQLTDGSAKSSSAPAKMTDIKGGFEKASSFGTSSGTELSRFGTTFQQGVGYLASYEIETTATFKGTLNHEDSYVFKLDDYDNNKNVGNFNLLGNPFSFNMDWSKVTSTNLVKGYAVVNKDGGYEYSTTGKIEVGDGFLVKVAGEDPTMSYNARSRKTENESSFLNIVSSGKAGNDNVVINLAGEQEGFPKINNFNQDIALVYVTENDIAYGIYNCNSEVQEVSLVFKASRMGEYNLHIEPNGNFDYVTLVDLYNGAETNMLTSSYSFTAIPKENGKRFVLKFAKGEGAAEDKFAFLSGNELIVETEGTVQIIDVMGRMVYSNDVTSDNNRIDVSKFNTAAYIIRLINDNGVKTQKIVVY